MKMKMNPFMTMNQQYLSAFFKINLQEKVVPQIKLLSNLKGSNQ